MEFNEIQIAFATAILMIERKLEPKCEECGYGVACQKCPIDLGGHCNSHEQEDTINFHNVIRTLEKKANLNDKYGWRYEIPLKLVTSLSDVEISLLNDLYEMPDKKAVSRKMDDRYNSLSDKKIVYYSASGMWYVNFTKQGLEWAEELFSKKEEI